MGFSSLPGPAAYERHYVPRLFEPWARLLLDRLDLRSGERLLDVATGPGTLARIAAARLGTTGRVVGTDLSPDMLAIARAKVAVSGAPIEWVEAPAAPLPFADESFDVVTCQQALQFFPDVLAALREMRRCLAPSGRVAIAVWASLAACEHFAAIDAAIDDAGMPAEWHVGVRAPFSRPDPVAASELLRAADFDHVTVDTPTLPLCFETVEQEIESLAVTPLARPLDELSRDARGRFLDAFRRRLAPFVREGGVVSSMRAVVSIGRKP